MHARATDRALVRINGYTHTRSTVGSTPSVYAGGGVPWSSLDERGPMAAHLEEFFVR